MRRDKFVPNKHSVLCSEHFVVGAYDDKVRLMNEMGMDVKTARLKRDAVPSIFLHKRQAPQRIRGAYAKRRRNEVVSELLSAPSAPPISSTAGADFTRSVTETLNCIEAVCEENEEPQCLDLSVPRAHQQDDEHHGPQVDTYDKGTQVLVRARVTSRSTQTKAPVKSVEVQASPLCADASTETESSLRATHPSINDDDVTSDEDPDETGESSGEGYDSSDDYDPFEGSEDSSNQPEATADCGRIFLVAEKHFKELFRVCQECLASCQVNIQCEGTVVEVYTQCPSDHRGYWINQDVIHQQPLLNLLIAAGILFAGCNPKASLRILSSIGVQTISCRTFFNLQQTHLFPAIERAASSEGDPSLIVPKWLSILNHVRDIHVHSNPLYPACAHGELEPREWLDDAIITKRHLLADLPQLSTRFQTYSLEAFHGLLIHYCPKFCQYSNKGMKAR
ncbi:hypothetical protein HPB47_021085 [Ixodes persulcatus]|uniref:Uncharacterized protein n=1 Tax=Ixodes persulcatus TaxID=34615 RepID=A0AC60QDX9_IXOPE|nr:hypothetical protein HPB47_021085 [Ixodes persulcatus]